MDLLPNELLLRIFDKLDAASLIKSRSVCKLWNLLIQPDNYLHVFEKQLLSEYKIDGLPSHLSPFQAYRCFKLWKRLDKACVNKYTVTNLNPFKEIQFFCLTPDGYAAIEGGNQIKFLNLHTLTTSEDYETEIRGLYADFMVTKNLIVILTENDVLHLYPRNKCQSLLVDTKVVYNVKSIKYHKNSNLLFFVKNECSIWSVDEYSESLEANLVLKMNAHEINCADRNYTACVQVFAPCARNLVEIKDFNIDKDSVVLLVASLAGNELVKITTRPNVLKPVLRYIFDSDNGIRSYICDDFGIFTNGLGLFFSVVGQSSNIHNKSEVRAEGIFYHAKILFLYEVRKIRCYQLDDPEQLLEFERFEKESLVMTIDLVFVQGRYITSITVFEYPDGHKLLIFTPYEIFVVNFDYFGNEDKINGNTEMSDDLIIKLSPNTI